MADFPWWSTGLLYVDIHLVSLDDHPILCNLRLVVLCLMGTEEQTPHLVIAVGGGLVTQK